MGQGQSGRGRGNAPRQGERRDQLPATENEQSSQRASANDRMKALLELIRQREAEIRAVLPRDIPYARFEAVFNMAIRRNPELLDCHGPSVIKAVIQAAYDGSMPDGNEAVILVSNNGYKRADGSFFKRKEARYQSMVYGLRKQLVESGAVTFCDAKVVFANEHFVHEEGLNPKLEHIPILDPEKRGAPIAAYAIARLPGGDRVFDVLGKMDVEAAREVAKTKNVWDGPFRFEMWKKTAIRRLRKAIPTARPIRDAEALDMFPEMVGTGAAGPLPPPRPDRRAYQQQLGHEQEIPFDLGAFDSREEEYVPTDGADDEQRENAQKGEPEPEKAKSRAGKSKTGGDAEAKVTNGPEKTAQDQGGDGAALDKPDAESLTAPAAEQAPAVEIPADAEGWVAWAAQLCAAIPELGSIDALVVERKRQQPVMDKAPDEPLGQVQDAFAEQMTELMAGPAAGADRAEGKPAGDERA